MIKLLKIYTIFSLLIHSILFSVAYYFLEKMQGMRLSVNGYNPNYIFELENKMIVSRSVEKFVNYFIESRDLLYVGLLVALCFLLWGLFSFVLTKKDISLRVIWKDFIISSLFNIFLLTAFLLISFGIQYSLFYCFSKGVICEPNIPIQGIPVPTNG